MISPKCDAAAPDGTRCADRIDWWLDAQWSEADFGQWYACSEHVDQVEHWLWSRRVEGRRTDSVYVHPIETLPM